MRPRRIRSNIYLPVVRFGVVSSDWKFVLAATLLGYAIPFWLDLKLWRVPLELWTGILAAVLSIAFFNFVRIGRRPFWLQHHLRAFTESPNKRRTLPRDLLRRPRTVVDETRSLIVEPMTIIGGILAATGAGFGIGAGMRLLPVGLRAGRDLKQWRASTEAKSHRAHR